MNRQKLVSQIRRYVPYNEQEEADKALILNWIEKNDDAFLRISDVRPVSEEIFSLESLTVDGHVKKGRYVSSHLHLNVTYLLEADSEEQVSVKADENSGVAWFTPEEALKKSTEPWFVERVYAKLVEKTISLLMNE